jgi:transcription initiation factor TFIIIB Brf1 subunit/transcription initiation factor TFIIB
MDWSDSVKCKAITKRIDDLEIVSENAPTSVAACALYFYIHVNGLEFTKKQIAEVCEVSEVTITKCFKRLMKFKDLILLEEK